MMKDRIKQLRKELHMSQTEFASSIGLHRSTISSYECGRVEPPENIQNSICQVFKVNRRWLSDGERKVFVRETENMSYRWFMPWDPSGKNDPSHLWLVDKVTGFTDTKVNLLAEIAEAMR